jgi:hypothetical protein
MATVELRELKQHGKTRRLETTDVEVDANDADACVDLLRRMAKKHGKSAGDVEIQVRNGRKAPHTYRI